MLNRDELHLKCYKTHKNISAFNQNVKVDWINCPQNCFWLTGEKKSNYRNYCWKNLHAHLIWTLEFHPFITGLAAQVSLFMRLRLLCFSQTLTWRFLNKKTLVDLVILCLYCLLLKLNEDDHVFAHAYNGVVKVWLKQFTIYLCPSSAQEFKF